MIYTVQGSAHATLRSTRTTLGAPEIDWQTVSLEPNQPLSYYLAWSQSNFCSRINRYFDLCRAFDNEDLKLFKECEERYFLYQGRSKVIW